MKSKKWIFAPSNDERALALAASLGLSELAAKILSARGNQTAALAEAFLDKSVGGINDPFLLKDMDLACQIIEEAIEAKEKIAIYGDYDVDGVTATCIMIKYLQGRGVDCMYYIPDRLGEGYGLNVAAIDSLHEQGCTLLITVDSGITAAEEALHAKNLGMRVIITDHHECKEELPAADAVINPRREDSDYPFRELAGVGVAFKLICALEQLRGKDVEWLLNEYADIVAVGTIADVMPLVLENRVIVSWGLDRLKNTKNLGLRALMQKLGLDQKPLTANSVSFVMAPRINAAGRLGGASSAAKMFLTESLDEAHHLADYLCDLNRQRQEEENAIFNEIQARLLAEPKLTLGKTLTLWGDNWHNGVIGIVSSRLADKYGMPCVLISMDGDVGKGSGRSIKGFNLYGALEANSHLLEKHGGHELAVGLSVNRENLEALAAGLEEYAQNDSGENQLSNSIDIDCAVQPYELSIDSIKSLSVLEPFGMGNPQPAFFMGDVAIEEITPISQDRHIKLSILKDGIRFFAFYFGMGAKNCPYESGDVVDIVFSAEINTFRGRQNVQLVIKDIKRAQSERDLDEQYLKHYEAFKQGGDIDEETARLLSPTKEELRAIFRYIKINAEGKILEADLHSIYRKIRYNSRTSINVARFLVCLDVFCESNIFSYDLFGDKIVITCSDYEGRANISGSKIIKRLMDAIKA